MTQASPLRLSPLKGKKDRWNRRSPPSPEAVSAAQALAEATEQFAQAQRATGQGAVEISGQEEVANQPLREGLEAASELQLGLPPEPAPEPETAAGEPPAGNEQMADAGQPAGEPPAAGQPAGQEPAGEAGQPAGQAPPSGQGQPAAAGQPEGSGQPAPPPTGQGEMPAAPPEGSGMPAAPEPADLGTGFVPNSPEITAAQIAGPAAMEQAAETLAQAQAQGQPSAPMPGEGQPESAQGQAESQGQEQGQQPGQAEQPMPGQTNPMPTAGGVAQSGEAANNQKPPPSALTLQTEAKGDSRAEDSQQDADVKIRSVEKESWFAKLPPDLRKAIQARARRPAPRGYEERLRRYFESLD